MGNRHMRRSLVGLACAASAFGLISCLGFRPSAGAQGWNASEQQAWYGATQGSRLMPYAWAKALEAPGSTQPFFAAAHLRGFRFIERVPASEFGLPVGFSVDGSDDSQLNVTRLRWYEGQGANEQWLGLTCAACHTGQITYKGAALTVDGGPSLFDFQSFVEAVDKALDETATQPERWDRFATAVLAGKDSAANRALLKAELERLLAWEDRVEALNRTPLRYGYARVDAFGHIYNKVALYVGEKEPLVNPSDAPVSYPFLWDISEHRQLQWNGIAENVRLKLGWGRYLDYGALGRNAGEVIGVFGEVVPSPAQTLDGYPSSVRVDNLERIESQLARLHPPAWPAAMFGAIDAQKASAGEALYRDHCISCHKLKQEVKKGERYERMIRFDQVGEENRTDPGMACNAFTYQARSGLLTGSKSGFFNGEPLPEIGQTANLLETVVKGALVGKKLEVIKAATRIFLGIREEPRAFEPEILSAEDRKRERLRECLQGRDDLLAYKSRPLDGIWATPPYLHNGSVPTLFDLLLPADRRPRSFQVGTREYDPTKVGYEVAGPGNDFRFATVDADGEPIAGNSNMGHNYGASAMTDEERWALVEYLKTL